MIYALIILALAAPCILLKTPWGYIDLLHTWEGWTLIGVVVLLALAVYWMEWGEAKCPAFSKAKGITHKIRSINLNWDCPVCHGSGRVRRAWISGLIGRVFHFLRMWSKAKRGK